jgi:probable F420-dependent oxidoreductase
MAVSSTLKFGLHGINRGTCSFAGTAAHIARVAEEVGFDSIWTADHTVLPDPRPDWYHLESTFRMLDPVVTLAFIAAHTKTIRLGTGVIILPQRNPLILAKQLASVDVLSEGRLIFGLGVGYVELEFQALGVPFDDRSKRTSEYLEAIKVVWTESKPKYHGQYVSFEDIQSHPHPVQKPHPPIVVGGASKAAYRRTVEQANGWYGFGLSLEEVTQAVRGLKEAAERYVRPAYLSTLEISVNLSMPVDLDTAVHLANLGVHRIVLLIPADQSESEIEQFVLSMSKALIARV